MSEPSSLYVRLPLDAPAREAYRASVPPLPRAYPDWEAFARSRPMHGPLDVEAIRWNSGTTCGDILDTWLNDREPFAGNVFEDPDESGWTFSLLEFSENYGDYVSMLTVLRSASSFVSDGTRGVAVVHDFLWGSIATDVAVEVTAGASRILDPPPAEDIAIAAAHLQRHVDSIDPTS